MTQQNLSHGLRGRPTNPGVLRSNGWAGPEKRWWRKQQDAINFSLRSVDRAVSDIGIAVLLIDKITHGRGKTTALIQIRADFMGLASNLNRLTKTLRSVETSAERVGYNHSAYVVACVAEKIAAKCGSSHGARFERFGEEEYGQSADHPAPSVFRRLGKHASTIRRHLLVWDKKYE
jgi:hypothetical protein